VGGSYDAANARFSPSESTHVGGLAARPEEYERRVVGFFNEALL
jgi:hypothetical protein